jgi:hypothetical protein
MSAGLPHLEPNDSATELREAAWPDISLEEPWPDLREFMKNAVFLDVSPCGSIKI